MRWKALDRAMNLSEVPAPGDAAFQAFFATLIGHVASREGFSSKPFAQLTFPSNDNVKAIGKPDATNLAIFTVLSFALVVSR